MRNFFPALVLCAVTTVACGDDRIDLDQVPVGSDVAIAKEDGGLVKGALTARDAATVTLDVGATSRTIERAQVAAVQVMDPAQPEPAPPVPARFTEYTLPSGTALDVTLSTAVDSKTTRLNEPVVARIADAIVIDEETVVPANSQLTGTVTSVTPAGNVKGRGALTMTLTTLTIEGHEAPYTIRADKAWTANTTHKRDAATIGVPAAGGAVIGGILGGKKGAVIGGVVGAGAGTAAVLTTSGQEVSLASGTPVRVTLDAPVTVRVPIRK